MNRHLTVRERDQLLYNKPPQIIRVSSRRAKTETYRLLPAIIGLRDMNEASPPSITSSEMLVNAGMGSKGEMRRVRAKVAEFGKGRFRFSLQTEIEEDGLVFAEPSFA